MEPTTIMALSLALPLVLHAVAQVRLAWVRA